MPDLIMSGLTPAQTDQLLKLLRDPYVSGSIIAQKVCVVRFDSRLMISGFVQSYLVLIIAGLTTMSLLRANVL